MTLTIQQLETELDRVHPAASYSSGLPGDAKKTIREAFTELSLAGDEAEMLRKLLLEKSEQVARLEADLAYAKTSGDIKRLEFINPLDMTPIRDALRGAVGVGPVRFNRIDEPHLITVGRLTNSEREQIIDNVIKAGFRPLAQPDPRAPFWVPENWEQLEAAEPPKKRVAKPPVPPRPAGSTTVGASD